MSVATTIEFHKPTVGDLQKLLMILIAGKHINNNADVILCTGFVSDRINTAVSGGWFLDDSKLQISSPEMVDLDTRLLKEELTRIPDRTDLMDVVTIGIHHFLRMILPKKPSVLSMNGGRPDVICGIMDIVVIEGLLMKKDIDETGHVMIGHEVG
ncbi:hypothetical protein Tco_0256538 [Tanacetum coccineum]